VSIVVDVERRYAETPHARSHRPPTVSKYDDYRECLRLDFGFQCVYCLAFEAEVGPGARYGGFEIEHFRPKAAGKFPHLRNDYRNLFWACRACNGAKGSTWPNQREEARGYRFIDPNKEGLGAFLRIDGDDIVEVGVDPASRYTIEAIKLDSNLHVRRRRTRRETIRRAVLLEATAAQVRADNSNPESVALAEKVMREAKAIVAVLTGARPWDAPDECLCALPPS
jgi:5-methylcytosine-specific restriction endonuclease McrA